jgi:hypothetical protein
VLRSRSPPPALALPNAQVPLFACLCITRRWNASSLPG